MGFEALTFGFCLIIHAFINFDKVQFQYSKNNILFYLFLLFVL